jgi:hypothetical protein
MIRQLFTIRPIVMGTVEMILIRGALAYLMWTEFFFGIAQAAQTMPKGLAHWMDLSFLQDPNIFPTLKIIFGLALLLWVFGKFSVIACAYLLFLISAVGSLRNSYGNIHHGTQIIGMVMLGWLVGYAWRLWQTDSPRPWLNRLLSPERKDHEFATFLALQAAAGTYVIAGVSKLVNSGWAWITGLTNLSLHVEKIGYQHYLGTGDISRYDHAKDMATMLAAHPTATVWIVGSGLFFELGAFWAVWSRAHAFIFGIILWIMHVQIVWLMQLEFPMNSWVLAVLFINMPWLLLQGVKLTGLYDDTPAHR